MSGRARFLLLSLALLLCAQNALALRVLVVEPSRSDATLFEAFGRLRAELALQDFEIVVIRNAGRLSPGELEQSAQSQEAFAAVALQRSASSTMAEVWIVDRVTGKTVQRRLRIDSGRDGPMLLAIRAVDLLKTSLLELKPGERPPEDVLGVDEEDAPPELTRFARELRRFQINAGASVIVHPALGGSGGGAVGFLYHPVPRFAVGLKFVGPAFGADFHAGEDHASVRQEIALADLSWNLGASHPGARWEWGPQFGVGVSHLEATGSVAAPLIAKRSELWSFAAAGGVFVERYFNESVSLKLSASALSLIPQPVIAIGAEESAPLSLQGMGSLVLGISF